MRGKRRFKRTLTGWKERILWGGKIREELLIRLLRRHYRSLFRRLWELDKERPHFTNHRLTWFLFGFGDGAMRPYQLARAFYSAEALSPDDIVLDIGCGDGFLTNHFLATQCVEVDAIDIEPSAIREANRTNARSNITYLLRDAAKEPFPREKYDVIFWNGAIGHFAAPETALILKKIAAALKPDGVFAGSESLGHEGHDHLQFFKTDVDLANLFRPYLAHVSTKTLRYPINNGTFVRDEAYWRCSNSSARLAKVGWHDSNVR
jgi:2-polyprenyl-3-methyl-5-hydroxy-6-metoxy-1,4-benzoquinol methylase